MLVNHGKDTKLHVVEFVDQDEWRLGYKEVAASVIVHWSDLGHCRQEANCLHDERAFVMKERKAVLSHALAK